MNGPTARVGPFVCHCGRSASSPSGARWRRRVRPTLAVHRMAAPGDGSHSVSHPDVKKPRPQLLWTGFDLVGVAGFEPTTSSSRRRIPSVGGCRLVPSVLVAVLISTVAVGLVLTGLVPFCCLRRRRPPCSGIARTPAGELMAALRRSDGRPRHWSAGPVTTRIKINRANRSQPKATTMRPREPIRCRRASRDHASGGDQPYLRIRSSSSSCIFPPPKDKSSRPDSCSMISTSSGRTPTSDRLATIAW